MSISLTVSANKARIVVRRRNFSGPETEYDDVHTMDLGEAQGFAIRLAEAIKSAEEAKREQTKARVPEINRRIKELEFERESLIRELSLATEAVG